MPWWDRQPDAAPNKSVPVHLYGNDAISMLWGNVAYCVKRETGEGFIPVDCLK